MKQFTALSTLGNGIISPQALQPLVDNAPDKESLLTIKFCFHLYTRGNELCSLNVDHDFIYDESGRLVQFIMGNRTPQLRRYIGIDDTSAEILAVLLPKSGPVFLDLRPFERLKRLGKTLGIEVGSLLARRSCAAHSRWAGMSEVEVGTRMGLRAYAWSRHLFMPPGTRRLAGECFNLNFNLERIRALPRHSGRLKTTMVRNQEEAA